VVPIRTHKPEFMPVVVRISEADWANNGPEVRVSKSDQMTHLRDVFNVLSFLS
jgi:hypothetical protein